MMRILKIVLIISVSFFSLRYTNAQSGSIGVAIPVMTKNDIFNIKNTDGGPGYSGNGFYEFGLYYIYSTCSCSSYETGLEYSVHSLTVTSAPNGQEVISSQKSLSLLSIPASIKLNFLKYFFIGGGILLDMDLSLSSGLSNQTGIGASCGFGMKYDFKSGFSINANPYFKSHSWFSFSSNSNNQRLNESGIKIGLSYKLNNKKMTD